MIDQVLDRHFGTIASLAENVGIDANEIDFYCETGSRPITRGIHLTRKYKSKVYCFIEHWRSPNGKIYPNITFGTHKHGGIRETFNGYKVFHEENERFGQPIIKQKPISKKSAKPDNTEAWRKKELDLAVIAWNNASNENVASHPYIVSKGVIVTDAPIRRGIGKFGDCVMFQIKQLNGDVIGFQQIYENNIPNKDTNKYFIGRQKDGFIIIGDATRVKYGAWYCEGLATGLSIYHANGNRKTTLSNADKLPVVVCLNANNLKSVVIAHKESGCENIRIAADNDCENTNGNTGVSVALETAKAVKAEYIYLPENDGKKADFNDTLEFTRLTVELNKLDYFQKLIKFCPKNYLRKNAVKFAFYMTSQTPYPYNEKMAIEMIDNALSKRNADKIIILEATRIIRNSLIKRATRIKHLNTICEKAGITLHAMSNWTNAEIAESIRENMRGIWLDSRGLGAGKTKLLELMRKTLAQLKIAYVTHRVSLVTDACGRLTLENYKEIDPHKNIEHLGVCVNSLSKYTAVIEFNVLFLDEARQIIEHCLIGSVENRQAAYDALAKAIEIAELVIASDADMNDDTVNFLRKHANGKKINWIFASNAPSNKKIHLVRDYALIRVKVLNALVSGENVIVACTSKDESIRMHTYLLENGIDENALLLIHSENKGDFKQDAFLTSPNTQCVNYRCVIHSPTIGSGFSIEKPHFSTNFMLDSGNLPANDCLQMTARNRCADLIIYAFAPARNFDRCTDVEMLIKGENEKHLNYLTKGKFELNELGWSRIHHIAKRHEDLNDHANNVMLLADLKGMEIDYSDMQTCIDESEAMNQKGLSKRVKEQRAIDIISAAQIDHETAKELSGKNKTQEESNELNRYFTVLMAGTNKIKTDDALNFMKGAAKVLDNYELITADIERLKEHDNFNYQTKDKIKAKSSLHKIFNIILNAVKEHPHIDKKIAAKICELLTKHAAELAANGFSDYRKKSKNPVRTLSNFLEKIGYELEQESKTEFERFYTMKKIHYIERYANNRKALELALTTFFS